MVKKTLLLTLLFALVLGTGAASASFLEQPVRTMDDELARAAEAFPGFGGLFYDADGRAHVVVTTQPPRCTFSIWATMWSSSPATMNSTSSRTGVCGCAPPLSVSMAW